ncbi:DNRLRE domain-containing protein [Pontiella sulfatireligans]|uniref:Protease 1 n=1 Tax=Pontiella sulfatireligans TaxID=2750658 RepID=A0A6C2UGM2_9BACT|nr:DNRLRE domain-containing protein [Pontiella sulfatireligans]VGO18356.1 Protease 1 [Pontiella sulfatireligans]
MNRIKPILALLLISAPAWATDYYVSLSGSDTNSGTFSQPFATIQTAANEMDPGDTCHIRAGTYRETVIPPSRATSAALPIRYQAYPNETVTITGLDPVSGWTHHTGSIYRCAAPAPVSQLFVNNQLMLEARWPNSGINHLAPTNAAIETATSIVPGGVSTFSDSALSAFANGHWNGARMWYVPGSEWTSTSTLINDHTGNQLTFTNTSTSSSMQPEAGDPYFLYGSLKALDAPTEWFYDDAAGTLYLWAPGGIDPNTLTVEARTRRYAFDLKWDRDHIEIGGLTLHAASIVNASTSDHCLIENCRFMYPTPFWDTKIWGVDGGVFIKGSNNTVRECEVGYSWGDGITFNYNSISNTVENCLVYDCNWIGGLSGGIRASGTGHQIRKNTVFNTGRTGIVFRGCKQTLIEQNHISHVGWLTHDQGGMMTGGLNGEGTIITKNWVRDHNSEAWCTGIYLDNDSSNYLVHHNVVWNYDNSMRMNMSGVDNQVYNNTFFNASHESMGHYAPGGEVYTNVRTYNNLATDGPFRGTDLQNNLLDTEANIAFAGAAHGDFRTLENSTAIDYGRIIAGITDGHAGAAPDAGAYEFDGVDWVAGIDWTPDWNALPVSSFTNNGTAFDASASTDSDGFIIRYDWDFGDGTTGYGKTVVHAYASTGTYKVVLTAMDELSGTSSATNTVTAGAPPPPPVVGIFDIGTDLFMESDGTKHDTATLLAGKPVSGSDPLDARRAFLKFDLSALLDAPISNAVLRLYHIEGENDTWGNAYLNTVSSNWSFDSISWDHPIGSSLGVLVGKEGPFNQYHEKDITALVQTWQADPASNHGFRIRGDESHGINAKYFQSLEGARPPQIKVTYAAATAGIHISNATLDTELRPSISWPSTTDASYSLERSTNLLAGTWEAITNLSATPPTNLFSDPFATNLAFPLFYRIATP